MVLETDAAAKSTKQVLQAHSIPAGMSKDLLVALGLAPPGSTASPPPVNNQIQAPNGGAPQESVPPAPASPAPALPGPLVPPQGSALGAASRP